MTSYFITGASRGIGFGLCETLAKRPDTTVFAGARTITDQLEQLASSSSGRVEIVQMDATKSEDIKKAVAQVEKSLGGKGLDVLFNNAGIMGFTFNGIQNMYVPYYARIRRGLIQDRAGTISRTISRPT
jgi:NAD(P)-dependent dehydrogenase (short-subunit alcohol dehydrogenase family)